MLNTNKEGAKYIKGTVNFIDILRTTFKVCSQRLSVKFQKGVGEWCARLFMYILMNKIINEKFSLDILTHLLRCYDMLKMYFAYIFFVSILIRN